MQNFILEVDIPCTITSLVVDTRANKIKSWYLWEASEVHRWRLSTWQPKKVFVSLLAYWWTWNLFDPTVHYFTVSHYIKSRRHQRRLLSLSRGGTHSQERSVTRNCHFERTIKAQYNRKLYETVYYCIVESSKSRQTRQGHFMQTKKAKHGSTVSSLLYI